MKIVIEINESGDLVMESTPDVSMIQGIAMMEIAKTLIINNKQSANDLKVEGVNDDLQ